jgi:hypothetical protein
MRTITSLTTPHPADTPAERADHDGFEAAFGALAAAGIAFTVIHEGVGSGCDVFDHRPPLAA